MLRLLQLKLINHPVVGRIDLSLSENEDKSDQLYTTVLIGPNGTGKSFMLQSIVNIFREAGHYLNTGERSGSMKGSFYLKYAIDSDIVEISNATFARDSGLVYTAIPPTDDRSPLTFKVNGEKVVEMKFLPERLLASTMIFTDKFPAVIDANLPQYKYLGIRNIKSSRTAGTRDLDIKIVNSLTSNLHKSGFIDSLGSVLKDLKYTPSIIVRYTPKYRTAFYGHNLSIDDLRKMFGDWPTTFPQRKSEPWGKGHFHSIEDDSETLSLLVDFLNSKELIPYGKGGRCIEYDILRGGIRSQEYTALFHLHKLDLLSFPTIQLFKDREQDSFGFSESSSGEQNILFSLLSLIGNIEEKSIVLIDEPELSLHPNWQMQYFSILNDVFKGFKDLHFIVATHSHFLISDLKGESSKIIALKKENATISVVELPTAMDTFGWSAEDILYNVFNVATTRNKFVAEEIADILEELSRGSKDKINKIGSKTYENLQMLVHSLKDGDPLKDVVSSIIKRVN